MVRSFYLDFYFDFVTGFYRVSLFRFFGLLLPQRVEPCNALRYSYFLLFSFLRGEAVV